MVGTVGGITKSNQKWNSAYSEGHQEALNKERQGLLIRRKAEYSALQTGI